MKNHSWDVRGIPVTGVSNGMAADLISTKRTGGCLPSATSGLLIALILQIPAVTTMVWGNGRSGSRASRSPIDQNCVLIGAHNITIITYLGQDHPKRFVLGRRERGREHSNFKYAQHTLVPYILSGWRLPELENWRHIIETSRILRRTELQPCHHICQGQGSFKFNRDVVQLGGLLIDQFHFSAAL